MATTAENVTWQYRHPLMAVQFSIRQLTRSRLSGDENLSPSLFTLLQAKTCNSRFHASKLRTIFAAAAARE